MIIQWAIKQYVLKRLFYSEGLQSVNVKMVGYREWAYPLGEYRVCEYLVGDL